MSIHRLVLSGTFEDWQLQARKALAEEWRPTEVIWDEHSKQETLSLFDTSPDTLPQSQSNHRVPKSFLELAQMASRHSDDRKWSLLYRTLWRLTHGEPNLLRNPADVDFLQLNHYAKEVKKDAYRMMAFVRFRQMEVEGNSWFVAWYEPEHDVIDLNAEFFSNRFASMRWSILTPKKCMHWNGEEISFSSGVTKREAPQQDGVEALWVSYYSHIFNPARLKVKAMQAQLLKRNWKNLPEAAVIEPLIRTAPFRTDAMVEKSEFIRPRDSDFSEAPIPAGDNWHTLAEAARSCRACPLWKRSTCTVFGEGLLTCSVMLVGEQPGDQEDLQGKPFIGPAGQLLDRALKEAGLNRTDLYVTNAVKHFKFEPRGKRRVHKSANIREIRACRPWLEKEIEIVQPMLIVALGRTAAFSLFDHDVKVTENRGTIQKRIQGNDILITVHPSSLLRLQPDQDFNVEFGRFVSDLRQAVSHLNSNC